MRFELARMVRNVMRLALVGVACVGCGDDDSNGSGGSCEFKACGGDVVGTWEVDTACITFNEEPVPGDEPACEGAFRGADFSITGQQTFSEDGTTTLDFELSGSIDYTLDNECLQALANLTASDFVCSQLASFLAAARKTKVARARSPGIPAAARSKRTPNCSSPPRRTASKVTRSFTPTPSPRSSA